jgi:hypothetical protein
MAKKPKITAEDFESWRGNAVTQAVMGQLGNMIKSIDGYWLAQLSSATPSEPIVLTFLQVELRAKREIIEDVLNIQLEVLEEENADTGRIGRIAAQAAEKAKGRAI